MPAAVESMAYFGELPWHRQGTRLNQAATAAQAISAAGLDWEVQKQPLFTGPDRSVRMKDWFAVCRTDRLAEPTGGQLGVVGPHFEPLQNRDAFSFLDPVVGAGGAVFHTAGALRGGRQVWMLAKLPGEIRVVGDDIAEKYLLLANGHDGSMAVRILFTPIRVVCQNTLNLALRSNKGLAIRHYPDVAARVRAASELMGIAGRAFDRAGIVMQRMAAVSMLGDRLGQYLNCVIPLAGEGPALARSQAKHTRLTDLFHTGLGNDMPGVRGSLWAAYNAVTQWVDRESFTKRTREPLRSIWFGDGATIKQRAFLEAERLIGAN